MGLIFDLDRSLYPKSLAYKLYKPNANNNSPSIITADIEGGIKHFVVPNTGRHHPVAKIVYASSATTCTVISAFTSGCR